MSPLFQTLSFWIIMLALGVIGGMIYEIPEIVKRLAVEKEEKP